MLCAPKAVVQKLCDGLPTCRGMAQVGNAKRFTLLDERCAAADFTASAEQFVGWKRVL